MVREYWLDPPADPTRPVCPECGEECDVLYMDASGKIVGCDQCLTEIDAYDWMVAERDARLEEKGSYYRDE